MMSISMLVCLLIKARPIFSYVARYPAERASKLLQMAPDGSVKVHGLTYHSAECKNTFLHEEVKLVVM